MRSTIAAHYGGLMCRAEVTRKRFEDMTADLVARCEICIELLMQRAGLGWDDIDEVLPVGGSTRMPMIRAMLKRQSGKDPHVGVPPDEAVAHGAAVHGAILYSQYSRQSKLSEILPDMDDAAPSFDELTASLAALAEDTATPVEDAQVVDVNAHSLGVAARLPRNKRLINSIIIPKDTPLPTCRSKVFGLEEDNQREVVVRIIEGEASDASACTQIGRCVISPLPAGLKKGSPIEVMFTYNTRGRVLVRAVDQTSGVSAESDLQHETGLGDDELAALKNELNGMTIE
jgi:molecular chaperone DnaK